MLPKNRTSAFILSLVALSLCVACGMLTDRLLTGQAGFLNLAAWQTAILVTIILGMAYWVSRSRFVLGLDEIGFGLEGLVRWSAWGSLAGSLMALYFWAVISRLDEHQCLYMPLDLGGPPLILSLVYWLIFRRNLFTMNRDSKDAGKNTTQVERSLSRFMIIGGGFVAAVSWLVLLLRLDVTPKGLWMVSGGIMMGLSAILLGALSHKAEQNRVEKTAGWLAIGLELSAIVVLAVGVLMP